MKAEKRVEFSTTLFVCIIQGVFGLDLLIPSEKTRWTRFAGAQLAYHETARNSA
jgi:hypothetical protein